MRTVRFELLRPEEIIEERKHCPVIYVPIGPLEWHYLHLPIGTDALSAEAVAREVASRSGGVVFPTVFWGTERERAPAQLDDFGLPENAYIVGMDFPNNVLPSLYAREETFGILIRELLDRLIPLDYRIIVLVNGHGAKNHVEVLTRLAKEFSARTSTRVICAFALAQSAWRIVGHADAVETSVLMSIWPESVALDRLPPKSQSIPLRTGMADAAAFAGTPTPDHTLRREADPRFNASPEHGKVLFEQAVLEIAKQVTALLDEIEANRRSA